MMICIPQLFELVFIVDLLHFVGRDELGNKVNEGAELARWQSFNALVWWRGGEAYQHQQHKYVLVLMISVVGWGT